MDEAVPVCRLCGESIQDDSDEKTKLVDVFHDQQLSSIIKQLFSIKIKRITGISTLICPGCIKLTREFYSFSCLVKETQKKLGVQLKEKKLHKTDDRNKYEMIVCKKENTIKEENVGDEFENVLGDIPLEINFNDEDEMKLSVQTLFPISKEDPNPLDSEDEKLSNLKKAKDAIEDDSDWIVSDSDGSGSGGTESEDNSSSDSDSDYDSKTSKLEKKRNKKSKYKNSKIIERIDRSKLDRIGNIEMFKNGKLIMKKPEIDSLISKFYTLECDICDPAPRYKKLWGLLEHYLQKHNTKGYVVCCGGRHRKRKYIVSHMARHLQPSAFECPVCKKVCAQPSLVENHMKTHKPAAERALQCEECNKTFVNAIGLKRHKLIHISDDKKTYFTCNICGKLYNLYLSYKAHISTAHREIRHTCPECGKSFTTKGNLEIHMWLHDKDGTHQVTCEQCGIVCKNKIYYKHHIRRMHTTKEFKCNICDFSTYYQAKLNEHTFVRHTDNKPFICVVCGKRFKLKKVMETHMSLHTGERKYACKFCPKTFASSGNCHKHQKRIHLKQMSDNPTIPEWPRSKPVREIYAML